MENASKALIIAGAILISIVLVSVGVLVVNSLNPDDALNKMSEQEKQVFNGTYETLAGDSKSGNNVKSILSSVIANNSQNPDKAINVESTITGNALTLTTLSGSSSSDDIDTVAGSLSSLRNKINLNKKYKITLSYKSGVVNKITLADAQ